MIIQADTKSVTILDEEKLTSGGFNNTNIEVNLSNEYSGLATFVTFDKTKVPVIGNMIKPPTLKAGKCRIGVYAIEVKNGETVLRHSPSPAYVYVSYGSYREGCTENAPIPEITETEKIFTLINEAIENGKLKGEKGDKGEDGAPGPQGEQGLSERTIIDKSDITSITLNDNTEYRRNTVNSLNLSFPNNLSEPYYTAVVFTTNSSPIITINHTNHPLINNKLVMQGDDCKLEKFTPLSKKHYHIVFCWDGEYMIGRVNAIEVAI